MAKLPIFRLFGENNSEVEREIQPKLPLRDWTDLSISEKEIAIQEIYKNGWIKEHSEEILRTMEYMNSNYLRELPGKRLHQVPPKDPLNHYDSTEYTQKEKAALDFQDVLLSGTSSALIYRMLSKFLEIYIDNSEYNQAGKAKKKIEREEHLRKAFSNFDRLANCLNHIFEQFSINVVVTRSGLMPRQDQIIVDTVYIPTLTILSDPKWQSVSADLNTMFDNFKSKKYQEVITDAHRTVQRFFQILVGKEGKNAKGELKDLFREAKAKGYISSDKFTEPIVDVICKFLPAERATKSTAKPATTVVDSRDALLVMNASLILIQHCLQKTQ